MEARQVSPWDRTTEPVSEFGTVVAENDRPVRRRPW
jgi:hypothetical protein